MKLARLIPLLYLAASACGTPTAVELDESFRLAIGETALVEEANFALTFRGVQNDSRCPSDVQCVWAGNAVVELVATRPDSTQTTLGLNTTTTPRETTFESFVVALEGLEPGTRANVPIEPSAYRAVLRVSRR
jgi:hypothetical protein